MQLYFRPNNFLPLAIRELPLDSLIEKKCNSVFVFKVHSPFSCSGQQKRQQKKRRTTAERRKNEDENRKGRRGPLFGFSCGRSPKPGGLRTEPRAQRNVFNSPKAPQQGSRVSIASTNFPLAHFCSISSKGFSPQPFSLHK